MKKLYDRCREETRNLNLADLAFLAMVTSIMALHDFKVLAVILQIIFLLSVAMELILKKVHLFDSKTRTLYVLYYAAFFLWAALSYLWAEYKSTFVNMLISIAQVCAIGISTAYYISSRKRIRFAAFAIAVAAIVFSLRFVLDVPYEVWGQRGRIGDNLSYGSNRGPLMLSYFILLLVFLAITKEKGALYIPIAILMFIALLFGTRKVLVFLFVGTFAVLSAKALTKRQFALSTIRLIMVTGALFLVIMNVDVLYNSIGWRIADVRDVLTEQAYIDTSDEEIMLAESEKIMLAESEKIMLAESEEIMGSLKGVEAQPTAKPAKKSNSSASHRLEMVLSATKVFLTAPIQGVGLDGYRFVNPLRITYSHSNQFELLSTLGLIGFMLYYWFYAFMLVCAWRKKREDHLYLLVISFLTALFVTDVLGITYTSETTHVYIGFLVGIMCLNDKVSKLENQADSSERTLSIEA